jgi:RNA polymerase sigma-70 factor (ECF subfamily)
VNHSPRPGEKDACVEPAACARLLEQAFVRWQGELVGTLYHLVGNLDDARDALQEAFVKAWRQQHQVPQIDNLKAWIFRIALNTGRDLRESAWRRRKHALPEDDGALACSRRGPSEEASRHEELAMLRQALAELRPEEQEVFLLRQNGELTYEEIGQTLEIPVGTVKTRMRLAIAKLRRAMAEV